MKVHTFPAAALVFEGPNVATPASAAHVRLSLPEFGVPRVPAAFAPQIPLALPAFQCACILAGFGGAMTFPVLLSQSATLLLRRLAFVPDAAPAFNLSAGLGRVLTPLPMLALCATFLFAAGLG